MMSTPLPAEYPTTRSSGLSGYFCAEAFVTTATIVKIDTANRTRRRSMCWMPCNSVKLYYVIEQPRTRLEYRCLCPLGRLHPLLSDQRYRPWRSQELDQFLRSFRRLRRRGHPGGEHSELLNVRR